MKIQDIIFFVIFGIVLWKRDARWAAVSGLIALIISVPLFATWTFFTAERFTWYAATFFLLSIIFYLLDLRRTRTK